MGRQPYVSGLSALTAGLSVLEWAVAAVAALALVLLTLRLFGAI